MFRQLRDRLIAEGSLDQLTDKGIKVPTFLDGLTNEQILLAHVKCPQCGVLYLPVELARKIMAESCDAEDWLRRIADASLPYAHRHPDGTTRYLGYRPLARKAGAL